MEESILDAVFTVVEIFPVVAIASAFFVFLVRAMRYLDVGVSLKGGSLRLESGGPGNDRQQLAQKLDEVSAHNSDLSSRMSVMEAQLSAGLSSDHLSQTERDELVDHLRDGIRQAATKEFLEGIRDSVKGREFESVLEMLHERTVDRLSNELFALSRRGTLNLLLGMVMAVVGMLLLGYFIIAQSLNQPSPGLSLDYFVPRMSLVVFTEVFAYFFLRLYSNTLVEIKYFQNEITNIEARFLALRAALHTGPAESLVGVIRRIARTERNFVLEKGQTTAEIEHLKTEKQTIASLMSTILETLSERRQPKQ